MNHTIKGILIVVAITSMLIVGTSMVPIMQNSFAHKKSDFKKERDTNINTNIACAVAVTCPEGSTTVISPPQPQPPTTGTLIISKICSPPCPGDTFSIAVTGNNNPQPSSFTLSDGQTKSVTLGPGSFTVFETPSGFTPIFLSDCMRSLFPNTATGTISAGQTIKCIIDNLQ